MTGNVKVVNTFTDSPDSLPVNVVLIRGKFDTSELEDLIDSAMTLNQVTSLPLTGEELIARLRELTC